MTVLKEYRSRFEIYITILKAAHKHHVKTRIMYEVRISNPTINRKLAVLIGAGLLEERDGKFNTTAKGIAFMNSLCDISDVLEQIQLVKPGMLTRE